MFFFAQKCGANTFPPMDDAEKVIAEAEQAGFDLSLMELSLALTPEERVLHHAAALRFAMDLRAAGEAHYAQLALATPSTR